ncbi:MAG: hypothetical protein ACI9VR_003386 [Cognaticolwellia sp.]|jgi:hypothetical protein
MFDTLTASASSSSSSSSAAASADHLDQFSLSNGNKPSEKNNDKEPGGLPAELKGLKKVKVNIIGDAWDQMDQSEQASTVSYLWMREAAVKKSKKLKGVTVTISSSTIDEATDEGIKAKEAEETKNADKMGRGNASVKGIIDVNKENRTVPIKDVIQAEAEEKKSFDASSTFPSDQWQAETMNDAAFNASLELAAEEMKRLQDAYGDKVGLNFTVRAGESLVPSRNYKTGELMKLRAKTAVEQAKAYFEAAGIDTENIKFNESTTLGVTAWEPKKGARHADYTAEQFLSVDVEMNGAPPPVEIAGEPENSAGIVTMEQKSEWKRGAFSGGGSNTKKGKKYKKPKKQKTKFSVADCWNP